MQLSSILIWLPLFLSFCCFNRGQLWPRQEVLVGFWPFDDVTATTDIANDDNLQLVDTHYARLETNIFGPFGVPNTSYTVSNAETGIKIGQRTDLPLDQAFTTTFYFYYTNITNDLGGIFEYYDEENGRMLTLSYEQPNTLSFCGSENALKYPILEPNKWNFISFTYDKSSMLLNVYDETGATVGSDWLATFDDRQIDAFRVGYGTTKFDDENWVDVSMKPTDAIACLMIHNTTLPDSDIVQLSEQCRFKGRRTPKVGWPQRDSLLAFWPFCYDSNTRDIQNGLQLWVSDGSKLMTSLKGPFNVTRTSYSIKKQDSFIGLRNDVGLAEKFTISFYFYTKGIGKGAILWFPILRNDFPNGFAINYAEPSFLEIWGGLNEQVGTKAAPYYKLIARFNVITQNDWSFITITYEKATGDLFVFNENGAKIDSAKANLPLSRNASEDALMFVGYSSSAYDSELYMKPTDAIACLMIYKTALTPQEIANLPKVCHAEGHANTSIANKPLSPKKHVTSSQISAWPKSLTAFWPLDREFILSDILSDPYQPFLADNPDQLTFTDGPFGLANSSYALTEDGSFASVQLFKFKTTGFTISFYYYANGKAERRAIFMFDSANPVTRNYLDFVYVHRYMVEIYWRRESSWSTDDKLLARVPAIDTNSWHLIAITYDKRTRKLQLFDEDGSRVAIAAPAELPLFDHSHQTTLYLGKTVTGSLSMKANDSVSCAMFFDEPLTSSQISGIKDYCAKKARPEADYGTFPRSDALLGCWPFDSETKLRDVAYGWPLASNFAKLVTDMPGPFGTPSSSYSVDYGDTYIGLVSLGQRSVFYWSQSFTVSFYFYTLVKGYGVIFVFYGNYPNFFALTYSEPNTMEIWYGSSDEWSGGTDSKRVGRYPILERKVWQFITVTYDHPARLVRVYENATRLYSAAANLTTNQYHGFDVGSYHFKDINMKTTDAIACLMVYNEALNATEIGQIPKACKTKGQGPTTIPPPTTTLVPTTTTEIPTTTTGKPDSSRRETSSQTILSACYVLFLITMYNYV